MGARPAQLLLVLADVVLVNCSILAAYWLRFDGRIPPEYLANWELQAVLVSLIRVAAFWSFALYRSLWLYASTAELIWVVEAVTLGSVAVWGLGFVLPALDMPRSIALLSWLLCIFAIGGIRISFRLWREWRSSGAASSSKRVLVIGAGAAGSLVVREMDRDAGARRPVAFIDDDPNKQGMLIHGVPVVGTRQEITEAVATWRIDEIILALPSAPKKDVRDILTLCQTAGASVRILPGVYDILNGKVSVSQIRDVGIEDLLGREAVQTDLREIARYLQGERVMVTGAGGSIGSELSRQIAWYHPEIMILLGRGENSVYEIDQELSISNPHLNKHAVVADVRDLQRMDEVFGAFRPTVVFHAAAHKHVPLMEAAPVEAVKNNVFGTKNVAELSDKYGVKRFVFISTDKAVNPTSIMGASKRLAEFTIQALAQVSLTRFCAVRFGNVLGSRGSVVPLFKKQIARGGPVTVTDAEMTRYFMTIPEAASLVIQAGAMGEGGEVFVLDMGEPVRIMDLAKDMIRLSGYEPGVDIKVEVTGMRPGEKLYEELFTTQEGVVATRHERIFVASGAALDPDIETAARGNAPLQAVLEIAKALDAATGEVDAMGGQGRVVGART